MKIVCAIAALMLLVSLPLSAWAADDAAALFKSKCSACHGEKGDGKPAMKMPAVKGTKMTAEQIVDYLTKGQAGKRIHENPVAGVTPEQAKALADFVMSLK